MTTKKGFFLYRTLLFHLMRYGMSDMRNETLLETLKEEAEAELADSGLSPGAIKRVSEKLALKRFEKYAEIINKDLPPDAFD